MKLLRRLVFWCHLVTGLVAGAIVLVMSVTGVLLTYERQMLARADMGPYRAAAPAGVARLGPDAIVAAVRAVNPSASPTAVTMYADPEAPATVVAGRTIYVSPYTAQVLGEPGGQPRSFFRKITDWHRWLGVTGEGRATARMITGACNLAFLFLVVSGFYLWFPRTWTWRQVRAVAWFRGGLRGKARDFNWHNAIGLWTAIPLFIVVLSGVVISYPWASDLVYRAAGEAPPPRAQAGAGARAGGGDRVPVRPAGAVSVDPLWERAERQVVGWRSISMRLPVSPAGTVVFTIDRGDGGQPQKRGTLTLDARSGDVVKWEPFASLTAGRRLRSYLRFAHTGEVAGLTGQTIAGLASLGGVVLVWTGISLAVRRVWAWRLSAAALAPQTASSR